MATPVTTNRFALVIAAVAGDVRIESLMGREFVVVPAVLVQGQVLNNNLGATFLPPQDITDAWAQAWNFAPVVIHDHPTKRGVAISARTPEILNASGVGYVFGVQAVVKDDVTQLRGEVWLDKARADQVAELAKILTTLAEGGKVELSTGFVSMVEETAGTHNGKAYDLIIHPQGADHLAIFAEAVGACSLDDGCGLGANIQQKGDRVADPAKGDCERGRILQLMDRLANVLLLGGKEKDPPAAPLPPVASAAGCECRNILLQLKARGVRNTEIGMALNLSVEEVGKIERAETMDPPPAVLDGLKTLNAATLGANAEQSDEERRQKLVAALNDKFGGKDRYVWIEAVYSENNEVVFGVTLDTLEGRREECYKAGYTQDKDGLVTFAEAGRVERKVVYEPVKDGTLNKKGDEPMKEEPKPAALPAAPAPAANAEPAAKLPEDIIELKTKLAAAEAALAETRTTLAETKTEIATLRDIMAPAVQERERERQALVESLSANEKVPYDRAELEAKPVVELRKLDSMSRGVSYAGRGGPHVSTANEGAEGEQFVEPQPYFAKPAEQTDGKDSKGGK